MEKTRAEKCAHACTCTRTLTSDSRRDQGRCGVALLIVPVGLLQGRLETLHPVKCTRFSLLHVEHTRTNAHKLVPTSTHTTHTRSARRCT